MVKINLKRLLAEHRLNQSELAEMTGIRPSTICNMCNNNERFIKPENIDKICTVLGCGIADLIKYEPPLKTEGKNEGFKFI